MIESLPGDHRLEILFTSRFGFLENFCAQAVRYIGKGDDLEVSAARVDALNSFFVRSIGHRGLHDEFVVFAEFAEKDRVVGRYDDAAIDTLEGFAHSVDPWRGERWQRKVWVVPDEG